MESELSILMHQTEQKMLNVHIIFEVTRHHTKFSLLLDSHRNSQLSSKVTTLLMLDLI